MGDGCLWKLGRMNTPGLIVKGVRDVKGTEHAELALGAKLK